MGPQQLTDAAEENCNRFRHHTASMIDFDYDLMGLSRHNNVALLDSSLLLEPFSDEDDLVGFQFDKDLHQLSSSSLPSKEIPEAGLPLDNSNE